MEGHFQKDTVAPVVTAVTIVNEQSLRLGFSEVVLRPDPQAFILSSEKIPGGVYPDSLQLVDKGIELFFPEVIPNRVAHQIRIERVLDFDGNQLRDTVVDVMRNEAQWGDLVFNEVMADPDPAVRYKEEYLELINRSEYMLNPEGWELKVNERTYLLNAAMVEQYSMELKPGDFMVVRGITLPNEGAVLSLHSKEGQQIHAASYRLPWDGPRWKKEGGWSLESPDAELLCRISANWEFSVDPGGGTPGRINSNVASLVDREPPLLLYAGLGGAGQLLLHYSEPLWLHGDGTAAIRLDPGGELPDSILLPGPLWEILQLHFPEDFQEWTTFQLTVSGLGDCAGNESGDHRIVAGAISPPGPASVVINEIMYDPDEGCPEYVELFLPGNRVFDLQDLAIHFVEEGGSPDNPILLSPHSRLMLPGQYLVLTASVPHLMEAHAIWRCRDSGWRWRDCPGCITAAGSSISPTGPPMWWIWPYTVMICIWSCWTIPGGSAWSG